jgi:hypothetical protein
LTQENNYAQGSGFNPQIYVSFFNELVTERKTMLKTSVSFLTSFPQRRKVVTLVTDIPLEEVKLIKEEREEGMSTFYEVCPRSI